MITRSSVIAFLLAGLVSRMGVAAQEASYQLVSARAGGDLARVKVMLDVKGRLGPEFENGGNRDQATDAVADPKSGEAAGQPAPVTISATGRYMYEERIATAPDRSSDSNLIAVRFYDHCNATLQVGRHEARRQVRDGRRLVVCDASNGAPILYAPEGPLSRDELDLIHVQGNSLVVHQLLPGQPVSVGDRWKPSDQAIARLLNLDSVHNSQVKATLLEVSRGLAIIKLTGRAEGHIDGVDSQVDLTGDLRFDLNWKRISWLQLSIREQRAGGIADPGFDVQAQLRMLVEPIDESPNLADVAVAELAERPDGGNTMLEFDSPEKGIRLLHDRRWHFTSDIGEAMVLRMVENDDFIAQCNGSMLPKLPAGKELALESFQQDIRRALGDRFGEFVEAVEDVNVGDLRTLRVVVTGLVSEVPIRWVYYHISDDAGRRASFAFTLKNELLERYAEADQQLIASFEFTKPKSAATSRTAQADSLP